MGDNITAFEITDIEGFMKSITDEAFTDSALLVGKSFFRKNKTDMVKFKVNIVDKKNLLIPKNEIILSLIEKCIFSTESSKDTIYIMPEDIEYIIGKISDDITYKILSHLTEMDFVEMCYSPLANDIIFRLKK